MTGCHNIHARIHGLFHQSSILRENQALLASFGMLPSDSAVLYCVQYSTLSLVSGCTPQITRCRVIWSMLNCFFGLKDKWGDSLPNTWQGRTEVTDGNPTQKPFATNQTRCDVIRTPSSLQWRDTWIKAFVLENVLYPSVFKRKVSEPGTYRFPCKVNRNLHTLFSR